MIFPNSNQLLASLKQETQRQLLAKLRLVDLHPGDILNPVGQSATYVYFPVDSIVSLRGLLEDGSSVEVAIVGNEGIVGISSFMGSQSVASSAVVGTGGTAFQVPGNAFYEEFHNSPDMRLNVLHYTLALIDQLAQSSICNRHHSIEQRLSRWLLMSIDRLQGNSVRVTQETVAQLLGVRREGVNQAANALQQLGAITFRRGEITVSDRALLESYACECYSVMEDQVSATRSIS